jgi:rhamnose transport system permease protein
MAGTRRVLKFRPNRDGGLGLLILLLLGLVSLLFPGFASLSNLLGMADDSALLVMLSLGEMLVLVTQAVDLSVAANVALTGMIVAKINEYHPEIGVVPVLIVAPMIGAALGAFNGVMVWRFRIPSIVVTLGTLSIYRGMVFVYSGGTWVNSDKMSPAFLGFINATALHLTVLSWFAIGMVVLVALFLRFTVTGRNLYAAGDNPSAARYAGIDPERMQFVAFTLSGTIAGLCGYFWVSRFGIAYTEIASGFELQVIAACVIGSISITGGVGTVTGAVLGALFLGIVKNALPLIRVSPFWEMAISGLVITVAVVLNARSLAVPGRRILEETAA